VASLDGNQIPQYQPITYQTPATADAQQKSGILREPVNYVGKPAAAAAHLPYFVQAGAYGSHAKANEVKQKLSHLGLVKVEPTTRSGVKLYRVRVGAADKTSASKIQSQMAGSGFTGAKIIAN
jgi:cell division protein FtsN